MRGSLFVLIISHFEEKSRIFSFRWAIVGSSACFFQEEISSMNDYSKQGFTLKSFDEHPAWENEKLPGEFTAVAIREFS